MNTTVSLCGATQLERIARQHPTHWHIAKLAHWLICLLIFAACSKDSSSEPDPAPAPLPGNQAKDWAVPPVIKAGENQYISFCYTEGDRRFFVRFTGEGWADLNNNGLQDDDEKTRRSDGTTEIDYFAESPTVTFYGSFRTFSVFKVNALDVSHSPALQELRIASRYLTQLDLRNNTDLAVLELLDMEHLTPLDLSKNINLSLVDISEVENFSIAQKEALAQSLPQKPGAVIVLSRFDPSEGDANNQKVLDLIGAKKWVAKHRHIKDEEKLLPFNGKLYPYIKTIDLGWATNPNIDTEEKHYLTLYTQLSKGEKFKFKNNFVHWIDLNNNGQQDKGEVPEGNGEEFSFVVDSPVITLYGIILDLNISNNKIKAVDASHLSALKKLDLSGNSLTQLILKENRLDQPDIKEINIMNNQLNKATMEAIAKSLHQKENDSGAKIILQDLSSGSPKSNEISPKILSIIREEKNFTPCYYKNGKLGGL